MKVMDRNYVSENQVVDRYLRGELTKEQCADFEAFYLSDQETLAELELAEKLQSGLRDAAVGGLLPAVERPNRFRRFVTSPQWAAAASVLLICSLAYTGFLQRQVDDATTVSVTRLVPILETRSAEAIAVPQGVAGTWVVLLVDPGFERYDTYRVTIVDASGHSVWVAPGLEPGYEDLLPVGIAGELLRPGSYQLRVEARSGAAAFVEIKRLPIIVR